MSLSDIVTVEITKTTSTVSRASFGTPLIMSSEADNLAAFALTNTIVYGSLAEMEDDLFSTTGRTYEIAQTIWSQNPKVKEIVVGRRNTPPTQAIELTPTAVHSTRYTVTINGVDISYDADSATTVAEITAGLTAAINASTIAGAATATDNTTKLTVANDVAGALISLTVADTSLLAVANTTADPGIVTDLTTIRTSATGNDDWYCVVIDNPGKAEILALAAHIETLPKIFAATSGDTAIITSATTDVASTLQDNDYARTFLMYHPDPFQHAAAAWAGAVLPKDPGSTTFKFKSLVGVPTYDLSTAQRTFALDKACNIYETVAGNNIAGEGVTSSGEFIDITIFIDFITARLQENIFGALINADKIPFTDPGIAVIENEVRGVMALGIKTGGFAADPAPTVTVPLAADVDDNDKANRLLPDVEFNATLAGAIHAVEVSGTVSV